MHVVVKTSYTDVILNEKNETKELGTLALNMCFSDFVSSLFIVC